MIGSIFAYRSPLHGAPPLPGQTLGEPVTRRVVFVLVDALREDTSLQPQVMPFLNELRQRGAWVTMHSRPPSYSQPGYTSLLTGAWPELSDGPAVNQDYEDIPTWTQDDLFSAATRAGLRTALSGYYWFEKLIPQGSVSTSFYTSGEDQFADRQVVDAALPWLEDGEYQLVLIHLDQLDYAGHHEGGPMGVRWEAAARRVDDLLREIASTLDLSRDTLFVCSDHGQIDPGGHGGHDPITLVEPFVLVGAGVAPGHYSDVDMVDVAPTLAALLGTNIPASSQGHVRTEMLDLKPDRLSAIQSALEAQQRQLLETYQAAIGRQVELIPGNDIVASHQSTLETARNVRLKAERLPRALLTLVVVLIPPVGVLRELRYGLPRLRTGGWFLGAAVLYVALFNSRYVVLDARPYSLSSLISAEDLILYTTTSTSMALVISWLVLSLGLKTFRRRPRQAAELVLGLTLTTVYVLALPVLWSFTLNGVVVTWALPDFASMFLAFLSLIQILLVATMGTALSGLTAVIAGFVGKKAA